MNIAQTHLEALKALGYTDVEARFLYLVATHSGYFTARQFLAFTGAHWGKRTTSFWRKLQSQKHARTECFPKGGVVYHLFSRRLYRQIKKENLRNRREHEFDFIERRTAIPPISPPISCCWIHAPYSSSYITILRGFRQVLFRSCSQISELDP